MLSYLSWVSVWTFLFHLLNTLRPRRNEQRFADDIFKRIFFNQNAWISIKISLKFVPKGPINNIPALVQIMAWRPSGDKPLSEPMMVSLPTHICVIRPQWVKGTFRLTLLSGIYACIYGILSNGQCQSPLLLLDTHHTFNVSSARYKGASSTTSRWRARLPIRSSIFLSFFSFFFLSFYRPAGPIWLGRLTFGQQQWAHKCPTATQMDKVLSGTRLRNYRIWSCAIWFSFMTPSFECAVFPLWGCLNTLLCYNRRASLRLESSILSNCGSHTYQNCFLTTILNFSLFWMKIQQFSYKVIQKMSSTKSRPFCVGLNVLRLILIVD